jgi:glycosyltransferase involved in cell wall biosynthesis
MSIESNPAVNGAQRSAEMPGHVHPSGSGNSAATPVAPKTDPETAITPRRKVRVLFLNDTARNGGPGRSLYTILRFLDPRLVHRTVVLPREGVIAELLSGRGRDAEAAPVFEDMLFVPNLVENPIEPWTRAITREDFRAPAALRGARLVGNIARGAASLAELSSIVRRGQYDLIYCNGTNADFAGGAVAWLTGVPALWHVRYTSLPKGIDRVHARLASSRGVRRIICVSKAAQALVPHVVHKTRIIHNALDIEEFAPGIKPCLRTELRLREGTVIFGSHGRVLRRKGYVEMIRAAKIALDRMTAGERERAAFVVIGDTPQDLGTDHVAECKALAVELGIKDKVFLLGFRADVRPYVADFDVAIVPSVYEDALPRAVIESMALGKPVLAFALGGVAEMLRDGETGALVRGSPPDVDGLAAEMVRYLRDGELRKRHGQAGRTLIETGFDGPTHSRQIQNEIVRTAGLA